MLHSLFFRAWSLPQILFLMHFDIAGKDRDEKEKHNVKCIVKNIIVIIIIFLLLCTYT